MSDLSYSEYRAALLELLAEVDPLSLVTIGAPRSEYEPEVDDLIKCGAQVSAGQVKETFVRWFGDPDGLIKDEDASRLANDIAALRARLRQAR